MQQKLDWDIYVKTLPEYLQHDIYAWEQGVKDQVSHLDCLYCELYGSINSAMWGNEITPDEARVLRAKYLDI